MFRIASISRMYRVKKIVINSYFGTNEMEHTCRKSKWCYNPMALSDISSYSDLFEIPLTEEYSHEWKMMRTQKLPTVVHLSENEGCALKFIRRKFLCSRRLHAAFGMKLRTDHFMSVFCMIFWLDYLGDSIEYLYGHQTTLLKSKLL